MEKHENENFDKQKAQNIQQFEKKKFRKQINQNILSKVNVFEGEKDNKKVKNQNKIKKGGGNNVADSKYSRNNENPKKAVRKPEGGKNPEKLKTSGPPILKKFEGDSANEHRKHMFLATSGSESKSHVPCTELKDGQGKNLTTVITCSSRTQISDTTTEVAEGNPGCEEPQLLNFVCS